MSVINTNSIALNAQRNLNTNSATLSTTIQRLSSGLRINSAKDDAAGLAISQKMSAQIRGMDQAARNANDGISLAQTAEGAMKAIGENLQRIRELAVQSANGTNSDENKAALQKEATQLSAEIARVIENTEFNGQKIFAFDGDADDGAGEAKTFMMQVGANATSNDQITVSIANLYELHAAASAEVVEPEDAVVDGDGNVTTPAVAGTPAGINILAAGTVATTDGTVDTNNVLSRVDGFLDTINDTRADLGAIQNRFSSVIANLQTNSENLSASRSRIQDTDYAKETVELTRTQILQQAGTAMLAQAKSAPQSVLSLLQ